MKLSIRSLIWLLLATLILAACNSADSFVPLPPPVRADYPLNQLVQSIGETEQVTMQSPFASVVYGQTGSFAGGTRQEEVCLKYSGQCATMLSVMWGSWEKAEIERFESFDEQGNVLGGWIEQTLDSASIFQWLHGCGSCTIDRSRLVFEYVAPERGATPQLTNVYYIEQWGLDGSNPMAFGTMHKWSTGLDALFPTQSIWGFWETTATPFEQVTGALARANQVLRTATPTMAVVDHDSVGREVLGRQTGMDIYRDGIKTGSIVFTYSNTWGQMPNTELIGKGSLSRIEWIEGDQYYAMVVLSSALSPEPTSVYMFCTTADCANYISINQQQWPLLYNQARNHEIAGLDFAVYSIGHIGDITRSTGESVVDVGDGGGVYYSVLGNPSFDQLNMAYQKISLLGQNGVKALGLYYATKPASGSGLEYYLAVLRLATAPQDRVLNEYGLDVGTLDRVGFLP